MEKKKTTSPNLFAKPGTLSAIISLLFIGGCTGPDPWEIGEWGLIGSIGMVLVSCPIIIGLTWLTTDRNLIRLKRVWLQFGGFLLLSLVLFIWGHYDWEFARIIPIVSLPYIFFITLLLDTVILLLGQDYYPYLPICILSPHFVMAALLYATNSKSLLVLQPIILSCVLWYITIPASLCIFVALIIARFVRLRRSRRAAASAKNRQPDLSTPSLQKKEQKNE